MRSWTLQFILTEFRPPLSQMLNTFKPSFPPWTSQEPLFLIKKGRGPTDNISKFHCLMNIQKHLHKGRIQIHIDKENLGTELFLTFIKKNSIFIASWLQQSGGLVTTAMLVFKKSKQNAHLLLIKPLRAVSRCRHGFSLIVRNMLKNLLGKVS